jgi:hypothetical protein
MAVKIQEGKIYLFSKIKLLLLLLESKIHEEDNITLIAMHLH